jgi:hypothetical protein
MLFALQHNVKLFDLLEIAKKEIIFCTTRQVVCSCMSSLACVFCFKLSHLFVQNYGMEKKEG